jgi:hypothetical protein
VFIVSIIDITLLDFLPCFHCSHDDSSEGHIGRIPYLPEWTWCNLGELDDDDRRRCCSFVDGCIICCRKLTRDGKCLSVSKDE